jgi:hypothetical protein
MPKHHLSIGGTPETFAVGTTVGLPLVDPLHHLLMMRFQHSMKSKSAGDTAHC